MALYRSTEKKMVAGVLAGIAETWSWDVSIVRLAVVFLSLMTAIVPAVMLYVAAAIIIPSKGEVS